MKYFSSDVEVSLQRYRRINQKMKKYSLVGLVWPNTEELISQLFMGLFMKDPIAAPGPYENQEV